MPAGKYLTPACRICMMDRDGDTLARPIPFPEKSSHCAAAGAAASHSSSGGCLSLDLCSRRSLVSSVPSLLDTCPRVERAGGPVSLLLRVRGGTELAQVSAARTPPADQSPPVRSVLAQLQWGPASPGNGQTFPDLGLSMPMERSGMKW